MNVKELKTKIKELSAEIKELKKYLRQNHDELDMVSSKMSRLSMLKAKIRSYYILYAFLRGKTYESIENQKSDISLFYRMSFYMKEVFGDNEEAKAAFKQWFFNTGKMKEAA